MVYINTPWQNVVSLADYKYLLKVNIVSKAFINVLATCRNVVKYCCRGVVYIIAPWQNVVSLSDYIYLLKVNIVSKTFLNVSATCRNVVKHSCRVIVYTMENCCFFR